MADLELYNGYAYQIIPDEDSLNPRTDHDNMGKIIGFHRRNNYGDEHNYKEPLDFFFDVLSKEQIVAVAATNAEERERLLDDFEYYEETMYARMRNADAIENLTEKLEEIAVVRPVFMYDHSGVYFSTAPFSCP